MKIIAGIVSFIQASLLLPCIWFIQFNLSGILKKFWTLSSRLWRIKWQLISLALTENFKIMWCSLYTWDVPFYPLLHNSFDKSQSHILKFVIWLVWDREGETLLHVPLISITGYFLKAKFCPFIFFCGFVKNICHCS